MNEHYRYPENLNNSLPLRGELLERWNEAMRALSQQRNQKLRWTIPIALAYVPLSFIIFGEYYLLFLILSAALMGFRYLIYEANYHYKVSDSRDSASFTLYYRSAPREAFRAYFAEVNRAKEGLKETIEVIWFIFWAPFKLFLICVVSSYGYVNDVFWLRSFRDLSQTLIDGPQDDSRQHIRGNEIHASMELSGSSPLTPAEESPPPEPLVVLDGNLTLLPDGGLVLVGGVAFDRDSKFSGLSINGVTLTRESVELLNVSQGDSKASYLYDGSSWTEVS